MFLQWLNIILVKHSVMKSYWFRLKTEIVKMSPRPFSINTQEVCKLKFEICCNHKSVMLSHAISKMDIVFQQRGYYTIQYLYNFY